jgi:hypothetical protein
MPNYLNRFLVLTGIVAVLSVVLAITALILNAPHDAYAGAVYAKVVPIFMPLYAGGIFSILWFLVSSSYALLLRIRSPALWGEQWQSPAFFCAASFLLLATFCVTAYEVKRNTDNYHKWDLMAKSSEIDLRTFKPLVDEFRREYNPQRFEITWRHQVVAEAASNPSAQADFLSYCTQQLHDVTDIMSDVAENPHTPEQVLRVFSESKQQDPYLAINPSTPPDILITLARSDDPLVRGHVAANLKVPQQVLEQLAHDKEEWIREWAAENLAKRVKDSNH